MREWRRTDELASNAAIPLTQKRGDEPHFQTVDDDIVELAAWFWTEGSYGWSRQVIDGERRPTDRPICLSISQSPGVNPANCERIEALLTRIFGAPGPFTTGAHWRIHFNKHSGSNTYKLDRVACWLLEDIAARPSKALNPRWLCSLTVAQLELLIDVSMLADGHETPEGHRRLSQANEDRTRSFEMACALAGQPTVTRTRRTKNPNHADEWHTTLLRSARSHAIASALRTDRSNGVMEPTVIDGPVWCPTTGTGTWLARRDGTVYVTGNSQAPRPHFGPALERTAAEYEEALAAAAVTWLDRVIEARGRARS